MRYVDNFLATRGSKIYVISCLQHTEVCIIVITRRGLAGKLCSLNRLKALLATRWILFEGPNAVTHVFPYL